MRKETKDILIVVVIGLVIVGCIKWLIFTPYTVNGASMHPTFETGDRVIVNKLSKKLNTLQHGDVIVFHEDADRDFIKRIIGVPGDQVKYQNDQLYINGQKINEPYLKSNQKEKAAEFLTENFDVSDIEGSDGRTTIPQGHYLVLGDNRMNSIDSRSFTVGFVAHESIVGEAFLRYWPLERAKFQFNPGTFEKVEA
ncbi:signal peptidase I [Staphylococcus intermedius]|uniref:Signal peptidase I n=2 Tax=Staphylococcus TaxID=1279 RepID=A0A380G4M4_STAIN|nr:signal peptidase I [Staphylococcus intermedius]PCF63992.1 S26 family signal peptidase [Staphylococcus intermedius]PCF78707.1 S26 family signal peptidase [Staphylococcus intermedius]PCF79680.1 S26 family signal peptidase [Staphylococcus intermedius]PCF85969.1 S26 family signal peptidase [Staphylococcus intermedius]PCF89661.1 S26 family signal peptidase [Staphylococcus intermedius]